VAGMLFWWSILNGIIDFKEDIRSGSLKKSLWEKLEVRKGV
jgi:hypothetical protein